MLLAGVVGATVAAAQGERQNRGPRGVDRAPAEGAPIPKVSAMTPDGKTTVELNKPQRLTVLVFGSYT